jgi:hypothetical protein
MQSVSSPPAEGGEDGGLPEWAVLVYATRHSCSGRSGYKRFNIVINERTLEMKPAWELYPVLDVEYGSRCSGAVKKWTSEKKVLAKAEEGWTILKSVLLRWDRGRKDIEVTYYYIPARETLEHERDHDKDYYDRVVLPDGRTLKVYKDGVELA